MEDQKEPVKEAQRARVAKASREAGTAEGWRTCVAAGAAQRTRLEKRKRWPQLEKGGQEKNASVKCFSLGFQSVSLLSSWKILKFNRPYPKSYF